MQVGNQKPGLQQSYQRDENPGGKITGNLMVEVFCIVFEGPELVDKKGSDGDDHKSDGLGD